MGSGCSFAVVLFLMLLWLLFCSLLGFWFSLGRVWCFKPAFFFLVTDLWALAVRALSPHVCFCGEPRAVRAGSPTCRLVFPGTPRWPVCGLPAAGRSEAVSLG